MANIDGPEPVNSLVTEKADKAYEFPTSTNSDSPQAETKPPSTAGESDFREASQSWDAKSSGGDARASAKAKLADMRGALVKNYRAASDTTDDFVHDNPWKAIVLAGLGGLIVGMLVSR
ncbi:membrane protein [Caballeronia arvi]|uniref:Membrane protein n=1 Tax=Caballeronia arvi TaxID=1777135 RepID=A0A158L275_9BURK|nr:DUF883 family protein [Caballeronia arvi]SAL86751.1 membrane protein [Caballeronia arvi]